MRDPFDRLMAKTLWVGDCLVFQGSGPREYGTFWVDGRKVYVHRWIYASTVGPIPDGLEIDHVRERGCHSKKCVNPAHLEPVTHGVNRSRSRLQVCRAGLHDLTDPANQRWDEKGQRRGCLPCWLARGRERYAVRAGPAQRRRRGPE